MKYLLDTDILIYFMKGHKQVTQKVLTTDPEKIFTSIVNQTELLFGAFHSSHEYANLKKMESLLDNLTICPFCDKSSYVFAKHKAHLKRVEL